LSPHKRASVDLRNPMPGSLVRFFQQVWQEISVIRTTYDDDGRILPPIVATFNINGGARCQRFWQPTEEEERCRLTELATQID